MKLPFSGPFPGPFSESFSGESRLIHAGAETAPAGLIRLSVGIEPAADLITDIDYALEVL